MSDRRETRIKHVKIEIYEFKDEGNDGKFTLKTYAIFGSIHTSYCRAIQGPRPTN